MDIFTHYHINESENGTEVILYLNVSVAEFSDELGSLSQKKASDLKQEAVTYVKNKLPSVKVKSIKIMAGTMLLTTLGLGILPSVQALAAETEVKQTRAASSTYTVSSGDTLYSIAKKYDTTVDGIKRANNLSSDILQIGQSLTIPSGAPSTTAQAPSTTYEVKSGDTLYSLSERYGTSVDAIKQANDLYSDIIQIGQSLTIPSGGPSATTQAPSTTYEVKSGDTLYSLAERYGTSVDAIKQANDLYSDIIQIGQSLTIPTSGATAQTLSTQTEQSEVNQEDLEWLAKMIYSEGRGESFEGQVAIGAVIMNRVESPLFPNTIKEVLFEKSYGYYQFTPAATGVIHTAKPNAENMEAARQAMNGVDPTNGALFFYNPDKTSSPYLKSRTVSKVIGNHTFAF